MARLFMIFLWFSWSFDIISFFHTYLCQSDVIGTQSTFQSDWNLDEKKMIHHLKIIKLWSIHYPVLYSYKNDLDLFSRANMNMELFYKQTLVIY